MGKGELMAVSYLTKTDTATQKGGADSNVKSGDQFNRAKAG